MLKTIKRALPMLFILLTFMGCPLFFSSHYDSFTLSNSGIGEVTITLSIETSGLSVVTIERQAAGESTWTTVKDKVSVSGSPFIDTGLKADASYTYKVTGYKSDNSSTVGSFENQSITTKKSLSAPATVAVSRTGTSNSTIGATVSWSAVDSATSYDIYVRDSYDVGDDHYFDDLTKFAKAAAVTGALSKTFSTADITGLKANFTNPTKLYFFVRSALGTSNSTLSTAVAPLSIFGASGPVDGLSISLTSASKVALSWKADQNADQYFVFRSTDATNFSSLATVASSSSTSYEDLTVTAGQTYYYKVVGSNNTYGPTQAEVIANVLDTTQAVSINTAIQSPTNFTASFSATSSSVNLSWSAVSTATGYKVYRTVNAGDYPAGATVLATMSGVSSTSYTDTNNLKNLTYYYWLTAIGSSGDESAPTASKKVVVSITPAAPGTPTATPYSDKVISLSWPAVNTTESVTYTVWQKDSSGNFNAIVDDTDIVSTSCIVAGLMASTSYTFRVTAKVGSASSAPSTVATATTLPVSPALTLTSDGSSITLSWTASSGASGYNIYQCGNNDGSGVYGKINGSSIVTATTYKVSPLSPATTYYFKVTSVDSSTHESNLNYVTAYSATTAALATPQAPTCSQSFSGGNYTVTANWGQVVSGADNYKVEYRVGSSGTWTTASSSVAGNQTSYSFTPAGAVQGNQIYVRVTAVSATLGSSNPSSIGNVQLL